MEELCFQLGDTHTKIQFLFSSVSSITAPPGACTALESPPSGELGPVSIDDALIQNSRNVLGAEQKLIPKPVDFYGMGVIVELLTLPSGVCSGNPNGTHPVKYRYI